MDNLLIILALFVGNLIPLFLILIAVLILARLVSDKPDIVTPGDQRYIDDFNFSPLQFYQIVKQQIEGREIPGTRVTETSYHEANVATSAKRIYLRVKRKDLRIEMCAAPFGNGYFFSWWLGQRLPIFRRLFRIIPFVGERIDIALWPDTYFTMDTEAMFKSAIKLCFDTAIDLVLTRKAPRLSGIVKQFTPAQSEVATP